MSECLYGQNGICKPTKHQAKAVREKLNRRARSLFKKALELSILCAVDTYVLIHDNGRFKSFNSNDENPWLVSAEKLVGYSPAAAN